jgi:hypothetical protein
VFPGLVGLALAFCAGLAVLPPLGTAKPATTGAKRPTDATQPQPQAPVDFDREIRPILSNNCFACHGPDEKQRKAKLRLDIRDGAFNELRAGGHAVVAGDPVKSELLRRVLSDDPTERMPPPKSNKRLTREQVDLLRRWIEQGAKWSEHWAFVPPKRPPLPQVQRRGWTRNPIDFFTLARLEKEGLTLSPEADRVRLIRRVTFDLTGLPPTPAEVEAFLADGSPDAYEKVVDRLLNSPAYGERMAMEWLDAARYADTHGYHIDSGRDMTRWREWVIDAFNHNLPFDRFTVEQLAGDLLSGATLEQKVASGFNRNHMINFEGGAIPEEYHTAYVVDRVNTTATVWLGLTMNCAQCHDHKYDPISQKEFYQLYAFFNNLPEKGLDGADGNAAPKIKAPTREQQRQLAELEQALKRLDEQLAARMARVSPVELKGLLEQRTTILKERSVLEKAIPTAMVMEEMPRPRDTFLLLRGEYDKKGEKVTAGVPAVFPPLPQGQPVNRLALARWLVDPGHPLTARVTVNRYWQMLFGTGLVKTTEDFGSQGERPSHPELLDWLATEFVGNGWDIKNLIRLMVTSATYRQSSVLTPALKAKDPDNRLLGRASRLRLQSEFIRDQALAVSGLLNREVGGSSVFPYQPEGLWQELASRGDGKRWSAQYYVQSHGQDLYRRTMYTFWKRACPPPTLMTFDSPDRETCSVRRQRTNTPLQALVLMNDPTYVEAARKLAERMMREAKAPEERIAFAFRLATARQPTKTELAVLRGIYEDELQTYRGNRQAALRLLAVGESARDERLAIEELAAWTVVASTILNLDETITRG